MSVFDKSSLKLLVQGFNYSGSGDWLDESGNGNDLSPFGSPTFSTDHFVLNGTTQYFRRLDDADFNIAAADSFTVLVKMSTASTTNNARLIDKRAAGAGWFLSIRNSSPDIGYRFHIFDAAANTASTGDTTALGDATIHVVGGIRDVAADDIAVYVDGSIDDSGGPTTDTTTATLANTSALHGGRAGDGTGFLACDLYAVAFWREALTEAEMAEASTALSDGFYPHANDISMLGVGRG